MPEPILVSIATAVATKAAAGLHDLVKKKFRKDPEATRALEAAEAAPGEAGPIRALAERLEVAERSDRKFARKLRAGWAQHTETGGAVNQIFGAVHGTAVQFGTFHGSIVLGTASSPTFEVTVYLGDESGHARVEAAIEELLLPAGIEVVERDDPILGSWFRHMRARVAQAPATREAAAVATHVLESRIVLAEDATVTATMMKNLGPVLTALQPTKDAVIRAGALLIVKVEGSVAVHQLTSAQQLQLDRQPQLVTSPREILPALKIPYAQEGLAGE